MFPEQTSYRQIATPELGGLAARAAAVLQRNDMGGWTRAAPNLYPHQWSWDSAFIAIGLAHLDTGRAAVEIRSLLDHQWKNGKVPHIVFNPDAPPESYFPGPEHWASAADADEAPSGPAPTSGLCQPPAHAIAVRRILEVAERRGEGVAGVRKFLAEIYPKLLAWHRYLATARDPEGSGLVTIFHPWESGTDNSPRWSAAMGRVEVGEMPDYERPDLNHVPDPSERPTGPEYDRFIWLVEVIKRDGCNDAATYDASPAVRKQRAEVAGARAVVVYVHSGGVRRRAGLRALRRLRASMGDDEQLLRAVVGFGKSGDAYLLTVWEGPVGAGRFLDSPRLAEVLQRWPNSGWANEWMPENEFGHWDGLRLRRNRNKHGLRVPEAARAAADLPTKGDSR